MKQYQNYRIYDPDRLIKSICIEPRALLTNYCFWNTFFWIQIIIIYEGVLGWREKYTMFTFLQALSPHTLHGVRTPTQTAFTDLSPLIINIDRFHMTGLCNKFKHCVFWWVCLSINRWRVLLLSHQLILNTGGRAFRAHRVATRPVIGQ